MWYRRNNSPFLIERIKPRLISGLFLSRFLYVYVKMNIFYMSFGCDIFADVAPCHSRNNFYLYFFLKSAGLV